MKITLFIKIAVFITAILMALQSNCQLIINSTATPAQMVQNILVGGGVTVSNVTFQGAYAATGVSQIGAFTNGGTTNLGMDQGIVIASGDVHTIPGTAANSVSIDIGGTGSAEIDAIAGNTSYDAAVLEFDFNPLDNHVSFDYIFASEEYNYYVNTGYNDAFGFFISGPNPLGGNYVNQNIALLPGTSTPVAINNVNNGNSSGCSAGPCENCTYFVENCNGTSIAFNAFTTVLTAQCDVTACVPYHIKIVVADVGDGVLDSGVFLKANSFSTDATDIQVTYSSASGNAAGEGCSTATVTVSTGTTLPTPQIINFTTTGTATNGTDFPVIPTTSVTIPANSNSTSFTVTPGIDGITEGIETIIFAIPSACGGIAYDTVYIADNSILSVNAGTDQSLCASALPATLTATSNGGVPTINFNWDNSAGSTATVSVSPASTTTYTVTATDACGQTATDQVIVNVIPNPTSTFTATTPICEGDPCTVTYTGNAGTGASYNWNFNGATIQSGSGQGPYVITWNTAGTYNLTLTVSEGGCTSTQSTQSVTVYAAGSPQCCVMPTPNAGPDQSVCSYTTTLQGVASTTGTWTSVPATATFSNASSPTSSVTVTAGGTYQFTWTESNSASCTASDVVSVTFTQQPVANAGPNISVCQLTTSLQGVPSYGTGTWSQISGPGTISYTNVNSATTSISASVQGTYSLQWTEDNGNGCTSSDNVQVILTSQPATNAGADDAECASSYLLQGVASVGTGTWTVLSGPANVSFDNPNSPTATMTVGISGTYNLIWTENNGNGCVDADTVVIQLSQTPTSTFTISPIACSGNAATINFTGTASPLSSFNWNFDGGTAIPGTGPGPHSVTWTTTGLHNVSLFTSFNGCTSPTTTISVNNPTPLVINSIVPTHILCNGELNGAVNLTVSGGTPGYNFIWSNLANTEDLSGVGAGVYSVVVSDANQCTATNGTTINEPPAFFISTNPSSTICFQQPAYLTVSATGGTPGYNYIWSNGAISNTITVTPNTTTTYTVSATDNNGCTSNTSVTVYVSPPIEVTLIPNTDSICPGEPVMLTPLISGGVGAPYMIIDQDGHVLSPPIFVYPNESGNYSIYVEDACGTHDTGNVYIHVFPLPPAGALADSLAGCQPFTVHFNEVYPIDDRTFVWDFGDNENLSLAHNPVHTYTRPGTFDVTLTVTSKWGCKNIMTYADLITVYPKPNAQFIWTPEFASVIKPIVAFNNMTTNGSLYIWTFGDGDSSSVVHPVHRFPDAGSWPVQLIAISNMGCRDTVMYPVIIQEEFTFYAPTAFSPDFDGNNDFFFAIAHGIKESGFYLGVYDRWGEVIWETDKYSEIKEQSERWDGRAKNNDMVPVGSYTWFAKFKDFKGNDHEKSGAVTVVR